MNTSCSTRTIRYLMFSFNLLFVITGIILIAVGASIHSKYSDYDVFLDGKYFSLPNLLIATGALIFFISFLGCYGAFKESWLMLMAFSILLGLIFVFEFSAGIAGYVLRDKTISYLDDKLKWSLPLYKDRGDIKYMWDHIQAEFTCCGVSNLTDWTKELNQGNDLPISCCPMVNGIVGTFRCSYDPTDSTTVTAPGAATSALTEATDVTTEPSTLTPTSETGTTTGDTDTSSSSVTETTEVTTESSSIDTGSTTSELDSTTVSSTNSAPTKAQENNFRSKLERNVPDTSSSTSPPYTVGCRDAFGSWVKDHAVHIGVVGFIFAILQVGGIGFACHLSRQLKNRYYST